VMPGLSNIDGTRTDNAVRTGDCADAEEGL